MPTRHVLLPDHIVEAAAEQAHRDGTTPEALIQTCIEEKLRVSGNRSDDPVPASDQVPSEEPQTASDASGLFSFSFIRRLSHEVRTAVTSILGFTEILEKEVAISQQELVEIIQRGGTRLLRTIDAVVYLARLENDSIELRPESLDLGLQVHAIVEPYREEAEAKDVTLVVDHPSDALYLNIDPDVFLRIVRALVDNAVKFTDTGQVEVHIETEGGQAVLSVIDTGCGIDEAAAAAIFEPFSQRGAYEKDTVEGSGLGLTVTRMLVAFLGGTLEWESVPGQGSSFSVRFPARFLESSPAREPRKRSYQWGFDQLPPDQRVLLVEDDPAICQLVPVMLPDSYSIDVLTDVAAVLEQARSQRYDIVLMDINLGDRIDGVELMRRMREFEGYEDVLFIAVTAYAETHEGESFHEKGFDGYVGKPFSKKALYENLIQV